MLKSSFSDGTAQAPNSNHLSSQLSPPPPPPSLMSNTRAEPSGLDGMGHDLARAIGFLNFISLNGLLQAHEGNVVTLTRFSNAKWTNENIVAIIDLLDGLRDHQDVLRNGSLAEELAAIKTIQKTILENTNGAFQTNTDFVAALTEVLDTFKGNFETVLANQRNADERVEETQSTLEMLRKGLLIEATATRSLINETIGELKEEIERLITDISFAIASPNDDQGLSCVDRAQRTGGQFKVSTANAETIFVGLGNVSADLQHFGRVLSELDEDRKRYPNRTKTSIDQLMAESQKSLHDAAATSHRLRALEDKATVSERTQHDILAALFVVEAKLSTMEVKRDGEADSIRVLAASKAKLDKAEDSLLQGQLNQVLLTDQLLAEHQGWSSLWHSSCKWAFDI